MRTGVHVAFAPGSAGTRPIAGGELGERPPGELGWLASVLWPGADVRLAPPAEAKQRIAETYAVLPSAARPRLLAPLDVPAPVVRAIRSSVAWAPPARRLCSPSRAFASAVSPPLVVSYDRDPLPGELLVDHLRATFGRPDVILAIAFGEISPRRSPLVHVLTLDGDRLGLAKVGWSPRTRAALANEVSAIRSWIARVPRTFRVPSPVHEASWRGEGLVAVTAPLPRLETRRRGERLPPLEVTLEIARAGGVFVAPLDSTPWWRSVVRRCTSQAARVVLRWMHDLHGRRLLWHGSWHGDWTARNVTTRAGALYVEGWEHARDGVPFGLDPLHFHFQRELRSGTRAGRAAVTASRRSARALRALGVPSADQRLLMACYLAELVARAEEDGRDDPALLGQLRCWVARA